MRLWPVCAFASVCLVACQVYTDSLLQRSSDGGPHAGGSAGQSSAGSGGSSAGSGGSTAGSGGTAGADAATCDPIHPPPRPTQGAGIDGGPGDVVFALKDIVLDQGGDLWRSIGYDLDGLCSNPPNPQVECTAPSGGPPEIDGVRGTDNAFGHLVFPLLKATDPTIQARASAAQDAGVDDIVLHLSGWNGADNDPSVSVWIAQSVYAVPAGSTSAGQPNWDGTDSFYVDSSAFADGTFATPLIGNNNAYVAGRVLVFRMPDRSPIYFQSSRGTFDVNLTDATLTAKISADSTRLDPVILAGRWSLIDISTNFDKLGICPGSLQRQLADNLMANTADVRATPGTGGPGAICDAISVGLQFTGYPGKLGGLVSAPPSVSQCADAGTSDAGAM